MNSNAMCYDKQTMATLHEVVKTWILSICHEWQQYWDHDEQRLGVTDICCKGSDI